MKGNLKSVKMILLKRGTAKLTLGYYLHVLKIEIILIKFIGKTN
jgi:hypothetical protein